MLTVRADASERRASLVHPRARVARGRSSASLAWLMRSPCVPGVSADPSATAAQSKSSGTADPSWYDSTHSPCSQRLVMMLTGSSPRWGRRSCVWRCRRRWRTRPRQRLTHDAVRRAGGAQWSESRQLPTAVAPSPRLSMAGQGRRSAMVAYSRRKHRCRGGHVGRTEHQTGRDGTGA